MQRINSSLEEYVQSMMPDSDSDDKKKVARRNRPFDAPTYDKSNPPFETRAKELTLESLDIINLNEFNTELIEDIQREFNYLLKDLNNINLPPEMESAIKSGYIFNAYNQFVIMPALESAAKSGDKEQMARIKQQSEILRLVSDNLDKPLEETFEKVKQSNQKKINILCLAAVAEGVGQNHDPKTKLDTEDSEIRLKLGEKLGNINKVSSFKVQIYAAVESFQDSLPRVFGPSKKDNPSPSDKFPGVKMAFIEAMGRCVIKSQKELKKEIKINPMQSQDVVIRNLEQKKVAPLEEFTRDILSIQKNYEGRWIKQLRDKFLPKERDSYQYKLGVINEITKKLEGFLSQYPEVEMIEIRKQMHEFLHEKANQLRDHVDPKMRKSELVSQIDRTVSKLIFLNERDKKIDGQINKMENVNSPAGVPPTPVKDHKDDSGSSIIRQYRG